MPTYVFECPAPRCRKKAQFILAVSERNKQPRCACGKRMLRQMVPERVAVVGHAKHPIFRPFKERIKRALHGHEERGTIKNIRYKPSVLKRVYGNAA